VVTHPGHKLLGRSWERSTSLPPHSPPIRLSRRKPVKGSPGLCNAQVVALLTGVRHKSDQVLAVQVMGYFPMCFIVVEETCRSLHPVEKH
jgi:hypothetical protein